MNITALPYWWSRRDGLTPGSIRYHFNHEEHPGIRVWLARELAQHLAAAQSIKEIVDYGRTLKDHNPELFSRLIPQFNARIKELIDEGKPVHLPSWSIEILMPTLVEMGVHTLVLGE